MNDKTVRDHKCSCTAGQGTCNHIAGFLYQIAHYKTLGLKSVPDFVSKTSSPQQWHVPPRTHGIKPRDLLTVKFVKPKATESKGCVHSTLYNPINGEFPDLELMTNLQACLEHNHKTAQLYQVLPKQFDNIDTVTTTFGNAGSILSHQLPKPGNDGKIIKLPLTVRFPSLPTDECLFETTYCSVLTLNESQFMDGIKVSLEQCHEIEEITRKQSECPEWHKLRRNRITSSIFKDVVSRQKDFDTLCERIVSKRTIQTAAMKYGIEHEAEAALEYSNHENVNVTLCGFVVNPKVPFLGASPERLVYDPSEELPFGVLEIKCPQKASFKDCPYLSNQNDVFKLKPVHQYYHQIMGQMAITGLKWCDFVVWTVNDMHVERINFNEQLWSDMLDKLSVFYFEHLIYHFK